jgi:hypothetical protein
MKRIKPLKRRVDDVLKVLSKEGFHVVAGSDTGWFGDGMYILTNDRESLRITRSRKEEFLDIAFTSHPNEHDWYGVAELMVATGGLAFEDAVGDHAVPHDLDAKLAAYARIRPQIDAQLGENPATHEKLIMVRQRSKEYAQQKFGRKPR